MEWVLCALMGCAAVMVAVLVEGERSGARGSEEQAEREFLRWHEEWADVREAQEAYLRERRGR